MTDMFELADRLKELKERKAELAEETKANNAEIEQAEFQLSQLMASTETQNFQRAGTLFYLTTKTYASANKEQKDELFKALRSEGYGALITETVNANSLSAFVKEQMADNDDILPDWLEGKVNVFDKVTVGIRKSKEGKEVFNMSNELTKTNNGYIIPNVSSNVTEGIAEELNGLNISLDKVKIPAGGGLAFEVPGDDPDSPDSEKEVVGVIVDHYPLNSFWTEKYNGQNIAPSCYSTDNRTGIGTPGGECAKCPYNKFGSGEDGQSKACKNAHRLYILRSGELYPVVVTVPPTSLKSLSDYLAKRIVTKGLRSYGVVTKLTLKKATNNTGITYSQVQFSLSEKLTPEQTEILKGYGESIRSVTRNIDFMDSDVEDTVVEQPTEVDPETGEVIQPLE